MRRIIYISLSLIGTDDLALDAIVERAGAWNLAHDVTGMLWSNDMQFVQAIEGDDAAVAEAMQRIVADPRHTDIEIVFDRPIRNRMFGTWAMVHARSPDADIQGTAFMLGYAARQPSPAASRIADMMREHG